MAYDKMVDSAALDGNLTSVANAIRTASGATGNLAFPAGFVSALQNMKMIAEVRTVTLSSDINGNNATTTLLSGDPFIKAHYADAGFSAMWFPTTPVASATGVIHFNYLGNRNIGSTNKTQTGVGLRSSSASAIGVIGMNTAINGKGYAQHMRVDSSGNLLQYLSSGFILKSGTYTIILICAEE